MARNRYRLSLPHRNGHLVDVEARFDELDGERLELVMATWSPGSYLIREYARNVQDVEAEAPGRGPLFVHKRDKQTWVVELGGASSAVVRYRTYGYELTVRTNHIDDSHAFLNGASTYLWCPARAAEPVEVVVDPPDGWHVATQLSGGPRSFVAAHVDDLLDSPLHVAPEAPRALEVAGRPAKLVLWGHPYGHIGVDTLVADIQAVCDRHVRVFQEIPFDAYTFILMLASNHHGGLEHRRSAAMLATPLAFSNRKQYEELLELISHEFFHAWIVKRVRPRRFDPYDYIFENYTRVLWIMEGVTAYYDRHMVLRSGRMPAKSYLERLCTDWAKLVNTPGRTKQSLEESSFDAWVKLYRADENTPNTTVSYYLKGSLVMLCMDLDIRVRTGGKKSFDDILRHMWKKYGAPDRGFDESNVRNDFEEAVGLDLGVHFERFISGREDPDLAAALRSVGLLLKPGWNREPEDLAPDEPPAWLGIQSRREGARLLVGTQVAGGPAERGGLFAGDELVALDGIRVQDDLIKRLAGYRPGDRVRVTVFRRDQLLDTHVVLGERPPDKFEVAAMDDPDEEARRLYREWLGEDHPAR